MSFSVHILRERFLFYVRSICNAETEQHYSVMWKTLSVTLLTGIILAERNSPSLSMGEIAPDAGLRNYVPFEDSDKRRTPYSMQRHCIGLILNR